MELQINRVRIKRSRPVSNKSYSVLQLYFGSHLHKLSIESRILDSEMFSMKSRIRHKDWVDMLTECPKLYTKSTRSRGPRGDGDLVGRGGGSRGGMLSGSY